MPEFNILLVFSRCPWDASSRQSIIDKVKAFYAPAVKLNFTIREQDFGPVLWDKPRKYENNRGMTSHAQFINEDWYDEHVTRYALKLSKQRQEAYHAVILVLSTSDWPTSELRGNFGDCTQGVAQIYVCGPQGHNLMWNGMSTPYLYAYLQHELSHFIAAYLGVKDTTHQNLQWDSTIPARLLKDYKVTPYYAWYRGVMFTARATWRNLWRI